MNAKATEAMKAIGVDYVTGNMPMVSLDFQTRKLVEIAKVNYEKIQKFWLLMRQVQHFHRMDGFLW